MVQVANAFKIQLVERQVECLKRREILSTQRWDLRDRVELQVEILEELEVSELFQTHLIVSQVQRRQILEVAQVLLNHINDLL